MRLAHPAAAIVVVGDVLRYMGSGIGLVACFAKNCARIPDPDCQLRVAISGALAAFLGALDGVVFADLPAKSERLILHILRPAVALPR